MTCQPIQLTRKCISISGVDIELHKWGGGGGGSAAFSRGSAGRFFPLYEVCGSLKRWLRPSSIKQTQRVTSEGVCKPHVRDYRLNC